MRRKKTYKPAEPTASSPFEESIETALRHLDPKNRQGSRKKLIIRILPSGEVIISEEDPAKELVEAVASYVRAEMRDRILQALEPPADPASLGKAPPPPPLKEVSDKDREDARRELLRIGMSVR